MTILGTAIGGGGGGGGTTGSLTLLVVRFAAVLARLSRRGRLSSGSNVSSGVGVLSLTGDGVLSPGSDSCSSYCVSVVKRVGAGVIIRSPNKFTNRLLVVGLGVEVQVS